jgi:tetratricopeptide (TPR) repeat protein
MAFGTEFCAPSARAQQPDQAWQSEVRKYSDCRDWDDALRIVDQQIARSPGDLDIRAWRAQVLTWAGRLPEAGREFKEILKIETGNPDYWMGLATVYLHQGLTEEALKTADHAIELDPNRADLRATRAQIFHANTNSGEARVESLRALGLDPSSAEARSAASAISGGRKEELRFGFDQDVFSFTPANRDQWVSLVSKWTPRWTTSGAVSLYERGGINARNFVGSITRKQPLWGALTIGGATGHDNGVIPETGAFFELDHGFKIAGIGIPLPGF